jgi:Tfp pilus assembly protein PilF
MSDPLNAGAGQDLHAAWRDGARALREGRPAEALSRFQQIIAAGRASAPVWVGVAMAQRALGDPAGERSALQAALQGDPRDLHALLMLADHHAEAGDARAADSYYAAFASLAEAAGDPAWRADLARARAMGAQYAAAFAAQLRRELRDHPLDAPQSHRMRRAFDLLVGKSQLYVQQPRNFYFPELPNI